MKKFCVVLLLICLLGASPARAQELGANSQKASARQNGAPYKEFCDKPENHGVCKVCYPPSDYVIDALANPGVGQQKTTFGKSKTARVSIVNLNPFLYDYTVTVEDEEFPEPAIAAFFGTIKVFWGDLSSAAKAKPQVAGGEVPDSTRAGVAKALEAVKKSDALPSACDKNATEAYSYLLDLVNESKADLGSEDKKLFDQVVADFNQLVEKYAAALTAVNDPLIQCHDLYTNIASFRQSLDEKSPKLNKDARKLKTVVQGRSDQVSELMNLADQFRELYPNCKPLVNGFDSLTALRAYGQARIKFFTDNYLTPLNGVTGKQDEFAKLHKMIALVEKHAGALLRKEIVVGNYQARTIAMIGLARTPKPKEKDAEGESPDSAAIALAHSPVLSDVTPAEFVNFAPARPAGVASPAGARLFPAHATSLVPTFPMRPLAVSLNQSADETAAQDGGNQAGATAEKPHKLYFGGKNALFSLSGGFVVTTLEKPEYGPVLGVARDRNGNATNGDALAKVLGLTDKTDHRVTPLLMLNTRIYQKPAFGIHGSFGVTGRYDNQGPAVEYFPGLSLSLLDNRLFFTGGFYFGKQQRMAGDLFQNAPLGDNTSGLVRNEYHAKPGVSITFKIK
jgi:hypothetical protein